MKHIFLARWFLFSTFGAISWVGAAGQGFYIQPGAYLVIRDSGQLVLNNAGFNNNGQIIPGLSTIRFTGSAPDSVSFLGGNGTGSYYNLALDKTSKGLLLKSDISVTHSIDLIAGDSLNLNGHVVDLGSTGFLQGERNLPRITGAGGGYIQASVLLNAPVAVNPGNLGLVITSSKNLGSTVVRRGHELQTDGYNSGVNRYYDVLPTFNSGLAADLRIYYEDGELNTIPEANLTSFISSDFGNTWVNAGFSSKSSVENYVEVSGLNSLYRITLGNAMQALPARNISASGKIVNSRISVNWVAKLPVTRAIFGLERSSDGIHFAPITFLALNADAGGSFTGMLEDAAAPAGRLYYRIAVQQSNGPSLYSNTFTIDNSAISANKGILYPNPVADFVHIIFPAPACGLYHLHLFDMRGRLIQERTVYCNQGTSHIVADFKSLNKGLYILSMEGNGYRQTWGFSRQ